MVNIESGEYKLIESGTAMTADDASAGIRLHIDLYDKFKFELVVLFAPEQEKTQVGVETDEKESIIKLIFADQVGLISYGIGSLMEIARVDNKKIYVRIWITRMGESAKKIEYALFEKDEE